MMVRAMLANEKKLKAEIADLKSQLPQETEAKQDSAMMTAFKNKIKQKIDEELSKARQTGDKRQLMVRALLAKE